MYTMASLLGVYAPVLHFVAIETGRFDFDRRGILAWFCRFCLAMVAAIATAVPILFIPAFLLTSWHAVAQTHDHVCPRRVLASFVGIVAFIVVPSMVAVLLPPWRCTLDLRLDYRSLFQ
jgi:hypothetical protein